MSKITVAEWRAYVADPMWPSDLYIDDEIVSVGGLVLDSDQGCDSQFLATLDQTAAVSIEGFVRDSNEPMGYSIGLKSHVLAWRRKRTTATFAVEIAKDKADALKDLIRKNGGIVK